MDDDDVYLPSYISHSYSIMKERKVGCVGSDKMLFVMTQKDFGIHMIDCGNQVSLIHEATLMMTKKWFRASCGFCNNSQGEGRNIFVGHEKDVAITDITKIMCCIQHSGNTIQKLQFAQEENKVDVALNDEIILIIKDVLKI